MRVRVGTNVTLRANMSLSGKLKFKAGGGAGYNVSISSSRETVTQIVAITEGVPYPTGGSFSSFSTLSVRVDVNTTLL